MKGQSNNEEKWDGKWEVEGDNSQQHEEYEEVYATYNGEKHLLTHNLSTLPKNCKKFWPRRYQLFSLYDYGIYMTSELWYSVTPEILALESAQIINSLIPSAQEVLDVCCGGGGNTIQFAKMFSHVGAIDIKQVNVDCTTRNCLVYSVDNVWTATGDWKQLSTHNDWIPSRLNHKSKPFDFIFLSPPWGGTNYNRQGFDLMQMEPLGFEMLCTTFHHFSTNFGFFLPKLSNKQQIITMAHKLYGDHGSALVIPLYENDFLKGLYVLFGEEIIANHHTLEEYEVELLT